MSNIKRFTAINTPNKYFSENWDDTISVQELPDHIQGAGCFAKGTLVLTAHGYKAIDQLTLMDKILGYDRAGVVDFARIAQIHKHTKKEFNDDLYFVSCESGVIWPKGITGNHAVYDKVTNNHKLIRDFALGDILVDQFNNDVAITEIAIVPYEELSEDFCVYNLTVSLAHTYICGNPKAWIRVHNGGAGKNGVVPQGVEAPNTLQSSSVAYVLDLISHGPIVGIAGGTDIQKGIYFNNTPLKSPQGQSNFTGYFLESGIYTPVTPHIAATTGTPDQPVLSGFSDVETTVYAENRLVSYSSPVVVTIPDTGKQAVRLTLNFANGLWSQDFNTGDINGASVNFTIYTKSTTSSIWVPAATGPLKGKTTSAYMVDYLVSAPNECLAQPSLGWQVKVVRHDVDDAIGTKARSTSAFYLFSVTEIAYLTETYPNMAVVGLQVPAIAVNNSIPTRGYLVTGLIVQVPSNYDTVHRLYNGGRSITSFASDGATHTYDGGVNAGTAQGYWNKSFKWAWTDNPAWILYNLVTNNEYGLGDYLGVTVDVDVWSFYEASLFNDCTSWNPVTQQYSKKLIANGSSSSLVVTSIGVYGTATAPVTTAYVVVPGHSINTGDSVTISNVTGSHASLLNGTFGVSSIIDQNNIVINIPSTTITTTVTNSGITLRDNSTAGFEHRFIFNMPITSQQDAWQLLQAIAGSMWGILTTVNGKITLLQDRPKAVSRIFNTSNVLNGLFTYSGTEITTRTTAINVTFNDKNNLYQPKTISEWDETNVALYGYIPNDIVAVGCVDESQARRQAKFALNTALYQPEICVFGLGLNIIDLSIGDRIGTQDNFKVRPASQFISGRVVSASGIGTNTVTFSLDRTITLLTGTYAFGVAAPDGYGVLQPDGSTAVQSYIFNGTITTPTSSTVNSNTSVVIVHFASPLPACSTDYVNIEFYAYCEANGDYVDWWTVQSISETAKGQYALTCISYNPDKWLQIEDGLQFTPILVPSGLLQNQLPAPGTISFLPVFSNNTTSVANSLYISWEWDSTVIKDQVTFNLSWKVDYENWVTVKNIALPTYQIKNAVPGIYTVVITAVNIAGINSPQAQNSYNYYITTSSFKPITVDAGKLIADNVDVKGTSVTKPAKIIGTAITVQSIVVGSVYVIDNIGTTGNTTDFTALGASANTIGTQFTATHTYSGTTTGTIRPVTNNTASWGDSTCNGSVSYTSPIAVQFIPNNTTGEFTAGFESFAFSSGLISTFFLGIYCKAGLLYTNENDVVLPITGNYGSYTSNDILEVAYTGTSIVFSKNGTPFKTISSFTLDAGQSLSFVSSFLTPGVGLSNLSLGTYVTSSQSTILPPTDLRVTGTTGTTFATKDLHISWKENIYNTTAALQSFNTSSSLGSPNTNQLPLISTTSLAFGQTVQGNGVPLNTTILSITGNIVTLSKNLTKQASGSYSFSISGSLYAYILRIMDSNNINTLKEFIVFPDTTNAGGTFVYTYGQNTKDHTTPSRNVNVRVYAQDTLGNLSLAYAYAPFSNAQATGVTGFSILTLLDGISITIDPNSTDMDIAGFKIYRSLTSSFTKNDSTEIYDGASSSCTLTTPDNSNTYYYSVAAYDSFDKIGLVTAIEKSAISIGTTAIQWGLKDIVFSANNTTKVIKWTAGTIYKNGTAYSINAETTGKTWTSGVLYIYYSGSGNTLSTTTVTATAVAIGNYPLATYGLLADGTTYGLKGGDGSAFISGSQILAATVGTSQLIAGAVTATKLDTTNAVITGTAQIADGIISNAKIGNVISSADYNPTSASINIAGVIVPPYSGWALDKNGAITTYGTLTIRDSSNNLVLSSGDSPSLDYAYVGGSTAPEGNATRNVYQGVYSSTRSYDLGDIVLDSYGDAFICLVPVIGIAPVAGSYWGLYAAKGQDAITVQLSNEFEGIPAQSDGTVLSTSYSGTGTTITVYEGTSHLTFDNVGTANGTYKVTKTSSGITGGTIPTTANSNGDVVIPVASNLTADTATITFTITGKSKHGIAITGRAVQTIVKVKVGADGLDGASYTLSLSSPVVTKGTDNLFTPTTITASIYKVAGTTSPALYAGRFSVAVSTNGTTYGAATSTTSDATSYTYTIPANAKLVKISAYMAGGTTTKLDEEIVTVVSDATHSPTVIAVNENITFPAPISGYTGIDFTGSESTFTAYLGATKLTLDRTSTQPNTFSLTHGDYYYCGSTGTVTFTSDSYTLGGIQSMIADTAYAIIEITIRDASNTALPVITKRINYSLSRTGSTGMDGADASNFSINNSAVTFAKGLDNVISPSSLTLTTSYSNITSPTYQWKKNAANITGATGATYSIPVATDYASATTNTYMCVVSGTINGVSGTLNDSITIPLLINSQSASAVVLSNENMTFQAATDGTVSSFSGGSCDVKAFFGTTQLNVYPLYMVISYTGTAAAGYIYTTENAHGFSSVTNTASIIYNPTTATVLPGLVDGTLYYVTYVSTNTFKLSPTSARATFISPATTVTTTAVTRLLHPFTTDATNAFSAIINNATTTSVNVPDGTLNTTTNTFTVPAPTAMAADSAYVDVNCILTNAAGIPSRIDKRITYSKSKAGIQGPSVRITTDRTPVFTATDTVLTTGQAGITFTANLAGIASPSYAWTFYSDSVITPIVITGVTTNTYQCTLSQANFGSSRRALKVVCSVTSGSNTFIDYVTIHKVDKSTAAAGATVGATFGDTSGTGGNIDGQITPSNITSYIANLSVDTLQIAGNAVTVPMYITFSNVDITASLNTWGTHSSGSITPYIDIASFSIDLNGGTANSKTLISLDLRKLVSSYGGYVGHLNLYDIVLSNASGDTLGGITFTLEDVMYSVETYLQNISQIYPSTYFASLSGNINTTLYLKVRFITIALGGSGTSFTSPISYGTIVNTSSTNSYGNSVLTTTVYSSGSITVTGIKSSI